MAAKKKTKPEHPDTPSGRALAKVGEPPKDATSEELLAHGERYQAEKAKHRWGS
jgi:hypothetical protein